MAKTPPISFRFSNIRTQQFAMLEDAYDPAIEPGLQTKIGVGANPAHSTIGVNFGVRFVCGGNPFIVYECLCEFEVKSPPLKSFIDKKRNAFVLPQDFCLHLAVLTVGTSRGVLHEKLEGTAFEEFILPTIDLSDMIPGDVELKLPSDT